MPTQQTKSLKSGRWNWVWPNVDTAEAAAWATKQAFWATVFCAAVTGGFVLLGAVGIAFVQPLGIDSSALIDVAMFGAVAIGLWRQSRVAAWAGLVLFSAERPICGAPLG